MAWIDRVRSQIDERNAEIAQCLDSQQTGTLLR